MTMATHEGSCHCGAVTYSVELDLDAPAIECNCSICSRSGSLLLFAPADKFTLKSGGDNLTHYGFNSKRIDHAFCTTCGIKSFARGTGPDGKEMAAINVRCLTGANVFTQQRMQYDGANQ